MLPEFDCFACLLRLGVNTARLATPEPDRRERAVRAVLAYLAGAPFDRPPPLHGARIQAIVREQAGNPDPYRELKARFDRRGLALLPHLRRRLAEAPDPLALAVRFSLAGNIVDFAMGQEEADIQLEAEVERVVEAPLARDALEELRSALEGARRVLFLFDNAGELALDLPLIELIGPERVTGVVRGAPTLNDATREDAEAVGLAGRIELLDSGTDVPGTWLPSSRPELRRAFDEAEVVIAKGQGNFETLDEVRHPALFFLLQAKCRPVARRLGVPLGSLVVARGGRP